MFHSLHAVLLPLAILVPAATSTTDTSVSAADTSASATLSAPVPTHSKFWEGDLRTTNTVDYLGGVNPLTEGATYDFEVTAEGNGTNNLTFKIQQWVRTGWETIRERKLKPGQKRSGHFIVQNEAIGFDELFRIRLSRKILTKRIDYTVSLDRR
jgi:hypothetical protein